LTRRTLAMAHIISAGQTPSRDALYADDAVRALWKVPPTRVGFALGTFGADVEYLDTPAVVPHGSKKIQTILTNPTPDVHTARCRLDVPEGWDAPPAQSVEVPALGRRTVDWTLAIPGPRLLGNSNTVYLRVAAAQQVAQLGAPIVLIGARRLRISKPFALPGAARADLLNHSFGPENAAGDLLQPGARPGPWSIHHALGHDLELAPHLPAGQVIYVQGFFESAAERKVILGVPTTGSVKTWVNNQPLHNLLEVELFRPHAHKTQPYIEVTLRAGFNEILVKLLRPAGAGSFDAHLILADPASHNAGIVDMGWTCLPWDK